MTRHGLYQQLADAIRAHSGSEELVEAVYALACDERESAVAQCRDELLHQSGASANTPDQATDGDRLGHTELEAAMRWCPHVREVTPAGKGPKDAQVGNRYIDRDGSTHNNPAGCACVASYCMQWRWLDDSRGYCGISGRPTFQPLREPRRLPNRTPLERPTASEQRELFDDLYAAASCRDGT